MVDKLQTAIKEVEERFGKGAIRELSDSSVAEPVEAISTGNTKIDALTGVGGIPKGRITEIYGPESGGKTTLALQVIAEAQRQGGTAAFIDAEHALNLEHARSLGVNVDKLLISQPDCGEDALSIAEIMIRSGAVTVVVVDSVAALVPRNELEGDIGDAQMGLMARMMGQALRKINGAVSKTGTVLIFVNQVREKMGVLFGNPETTSGGRALKFFASLRIDLRRTESKKKGEEVIANVVKVKISKNKMAAPFREDKILLRFGQGFVND